MALAVACLDDRGCGGGVRRACRDFLTNVPGRGNMFVWCRYPFRFRHDELVLVLRPDIKAAANDEDVSRVWAETVEIGVALDWSRVPANALPPPPPAGGKKPR